MIYRSESGRSRFRSAICVYHRFPTFLSPSAIVRFPCSFCNQKHTLSDESKAIIIIGNSQTNINPSPVFLMFHFHTCKNAHTYVRYNIHCCMIDFLISKKEKRDFKIVHPLRLIHR